jgi:hypothetical protein
MVLTFNGISEKVALAPTKCKKETTIVHGIVNLALDTLAAPKPSIHRHTALSTQLGKLSAEARPEKQHRSSACSSTSALKQQKSCTSPAKIPRYTQST